ncbi:MAG: OadG family protein [Acetivibrionales bacterium]
MLESLYNGSDIAKGLLVTVIGMTGVFTVLVIFYLLIKVICKGVSDIRPEAAMKSNLL